MKTSKEFATTTFRTMVPFLADADKSGQTEIGDFYFISTVFVLL